MEPSNLNTLLPQVESYLGSVPLDGLPRECQWPAYRALPLAQGEYNLNYKVVARGTDCAAPWVFRINMGSQINRDDQIYYEYQALWLLEGTGVTPRPYFVDDTREHLDHGALGMEFLAGEAMDYRRDLEAAACTLAAIHSHPVDPDENHLIHEDAPLSMTYEECSRLLPVYLESELANPELVGYLSEVLAWAQQARHSERYLVEDPCRGIINTEVNSGNFIANRGAGTMHLVDWEKPLWGDPSQDLSHFSAPMTTLWKTDYRMSVGDRTRFLEAYRAATPDRHLADTIIERVRLRDPFNYLRGISWSAMAWVAYQMGDHAVRNEDTFRKVRSYLDLSFLRGLFDPYLLGRG